MERLIFILSISIGSVGAGYILRRVSGKKIAGSPEKVSSFSKNLKLFAMFTLNPIPMISSFWTFSLESPSLLLFPLFGIMVTFIGGASALLVNRLFQIPPKRAASVFTSGMFSNILTFGGLTAFVFFGSDGYVLIQLINMLVGVMYYLMGYPMSHQVSLGKKARFVLSPGILKGRPYLLGPIISAAAGILLNFLNIPKPDILNSISSFLIPLISGSLGFSIGITLYIGRMRYYRKEIMLVSLIKFIISPLSMVVVGYLFGLQHVMGGAPFKVLIIASAMPVAFNSLIPPAIYGFDLDLANSAWIATTFAYIIILPLLYLILGL